MRRGLNIARISIMDQMRFKYWPLLKYTWDAVDFLHLFLHLNLQLMHIFQVYYAYLAMSLATMRPAPPIAQSNSEEKTRANSIAYSALNIFIQDCKDLVVAGVQTSIKRQLENPDPLIHQKGLSRKRDLSSWQKSLYPLAWGPDTRHATETYALLVNIILDDPKPNAHLQHASERIGYMELAKKLVKMATSIFPIGAPVRLHGSFLPALKIALKHMESIWGQDNDGTQYSLQALSTMMRKMNIQFVPWHKESVGGNSKARTVMHDWWITIQHNVEDKNDPQGNFRSREDTCVAIADATALSDPSAPWDIPDSLHQMGRLWDKKVRPRDWKLSEASLTSGYVQQTYIYVDEHFSGDIWWHHMALVWAILFSRITPNIFRDRSISITATGEVEITKQIRALKWTTSTSDNHKGCTMPMPFVTMLSTAIIAMIDRKCPLWKEFKNGGFGKFWSDKHGMPVFTYFFSIHHDLTFLCKGMKQINAVNFIRMGLAKATSPGVLNTPRYGRNWEMLPLEKIRLRYDRVMQYLTKQPHGEYYAVEYLFGQDMADLLVKRKDIKRAGALKMATSSRFES